MKTIIAGSRSITDYNILQEAIIESQFMITRIISGHAKGVDELGEKYAAINNIPLDIFPANWNLFGKSAGIIRNREMARHADTLIAIWDGTSKGTKHMIDVADEKGLKVFIKNVIFK